MDRKSDIELFDATNFVHAALEDNTSRIPEEVEIFLDDDAFKSGKGLTYTVRRGQSLLYNVFKIWRELCLLENSLLLNRLTKSSITRIISPGRNGHNPYKIEGLFQIDDIQRRIISISGNVDINNKIEEIKKLKFPITPHAIRHDNNITYGFHFLYLGSERTISDGGIDIGKEVRDIDIQNEEYDESRISLPIRTSPTDNNPSGEIKNLIFDKAGGNEDILAKNSNSHPISISKMKREIIWCILKNIVLVKN